MSDNRTAVLLVGMWMFFVLLLHGEPDIIDAIIHALMKE